MKSRRANSRLVCWAVFGPALFLGVVIALWLGLEIVDDPLAPGRPGFQPSIRIEDRRGRLLREFLSSRETRSEWAGLENISPHLVHAAVAAEDKRFYKHFGVDPLALARAVRLNIKNGRVVSGASTITMQLARLLRPGPRTWRQKAIEAMLALRLELTHSKAEILEEYLNRVPCGNLVYGLPAAARLYLDRSPHNLSPAEAAFLMGLPQAPSLLNPYRRPELSLARRDRILDRMAALGFLSQDEAVRAKAEPLNLNHGGSRLRAPHFVTHIRAGLTQPAPARLRTTLDLELQTQIERLTAQAVALGREKGITQAAVLVMDHRTREVLAWVGSADFFEPGEGQNDGVTALRQPGSAVKPLTYAAAFAAGLTPATLIEDGRVEYGLRSGIYRPKNYDGRYRGPVTLRTALASSLNIPAIKVLSRVGLCKVYQKMKAAGLGSLKHEPEYYGLGLTLGCGEVSLLELANAYASLASGGLYLPPVLTLPAPDNGQGVKVFPPQAAYLVTHILSDDAARATGFGRDSLLSLPFPVAVKTGTSKNFRDNWTVGYTSSLVVAVWAGNFDGRPMARVSGISGAGPLWRRVMRLAAGYYPPGQFIRPDGLEEVSICPVTGLRASRHCPGRRLELFMSSTLPGGYCLVHHPRRTGAPRKNRPGNGLAILNPRSGEQYIFDPGLEDGFQKLELKARALAGLDWLIWYVNGDEAGRVRADVQPLPRFFWPLQRGRLIIKLAGQAHGQTVAVDQAAIMVH